MLGNILFQVQYSFQDQIFLNLIYALLILIIELEI